MLRKKSLVIITTLLCYFLTTATTPPNASFKITKGTNIAHWLSQSKKRGNLRTNFFTQNDVIKIKALGFDHIRLPIDEEQMWDEKNNKNQEAFQLLENAINWCEKHQLKVIVDLHILRSHHFNAKEKPLWTDEKEQLKFFDLWKDLSNTLKGFSNELVAYELMNEAVADDPEQWNSLLNKAFAEIRQIEPERTIIIGSNMWQSVDTFVDLKVPKNDPNIILSFHYYKPFLFSHYKTSWTELKNYTGPVNYPGIIVTQKDLKKLNPKAKKIAQQWAGKKFDIHFIEKSIQAPIKKAKELNLALYCGEFGIFNTTPKKDRLQWYEDIVSVLQKNNIGYANWNYKSNSFGLINDDGTENDKLIEIIVNK